MQRRLRGIWKTGAGTDPAKGTAFYDMSSLSFLEFLSCGVAKTVEAQKASHPFPYRHLSPPLHSPRSLLGWPSGPGQSESLLGWLRQEPNKTLG